MLIYLYFKYFRSCLLECIKFFAISGKKWFKWYFFWINSASSSFYTV